MTQLELLAIASAMPRDASGIIVKGHEAECLYFTSNEAPLDCGFSLLNQPTVHVTFAHSVGHNRWMARAIVKGAKI